MWKWVDKEENDYEKAAAMRPQLSDDYSQTVSAIEEYKQSGEG